MAFTAAQAIANYNANHAVAAQIVAGSATDILANLAGLATLQAAGKLSSVQLFGPANAANAAQAAQLAALTGFRVLVGSVFLVSDTASNLLDNANAVGVGKATTVRLTGSNAVTAAQAKLLATKRNFGLAAGATLVVSDSAANLYAATNAAGLAKATTVTLTGANTVNLVQAAKLAALHGFGLGSGATLQISDNAQRLLVSANAAGLAVATSVQLIGSGNIISAAQATLLAGLTGFSLGSGAKLVVADAAAQLLDAAYAAGRLVATGMQLTGDNAVTAAQAATSGAVPE